MEKHKVKLVIDTDGVTDDIRAISLALQSPHAEVLAVSCVNGCIPVRQAVANVARVLRANNAANVPIYRGAEGPIIGNKHSHANETHFFGSDGLGDAFDVSPKAVEEDFEAHEAGAHAAQALIELFAANRDATLVCIGPLTNVALALKLEPKFAALPRRLVVMGGNVHGAGNVRSGSTAEFNFSMDPEAAHVVLKEMRCEITVVPWEAFLMESSKKIEKYFRGQCALDWTDLLWSEDEMSHKVDRTQRPITFVKDYNVVELDKMIHEAIQNSTYTSETNGTAF